MGHNIDRCIIVTCVIKRAWLPHSAHIILTLLVFHKMQALAYRPPFWKTLAHSSHAVTNLVDNEAGD